MNTSTHESCDTTSLPHGRTPEPLPEPNDFAADLRALRSKLNHSLKGKAETIELVLACLFARGHLLLEDLPGIGKTTLAKALAQSVHGQFGRIQCTPDLLPGDVTGFNIFDQRTREFEFKPGPIFADVLLADEINRATPRTQSALFEAMAERQVTIDKRTYPLADTFFVVATQNPIDSQGTYPLPDAQLDRFALRLTIGYPDQAHEFEMLAEDAGQAGREAAAATAHALPLHRLRAIQRHVASVVVAGPVRQYLIDLATATRNHPRVVCGISPRGLLIWQRVAQARAFLQSRDFVVPEDVQDTGPAVLGLRLASDHGLADQLAHEVLAQVAIPGSAIQA
ncbi:MAG: MoxR family ATPase [Pirellulales bacterium]